MSEEKSKRREKLLMEREADVGLPSKGELGRMMKMADYFVKSGIMPDDIDTKEKAITLMMTGRDLGIPPSTALRSINVIKGRAALSAQLMKGLVERKGLGKFQMEANNKKATVKVKRLDIEDDGWFESTWTWEDAKRAKLAYKDNWKKYPKQMLLNRAIADAIRFKFPDVFSSVYTPEEAESIPNESITQEVDVEVPEKEGKKEKVKKPEKEEVADTELMVSNEQVKAIHTIAKDKLDEEEYKNFLKREFGVESSKDLTKKDATVAINKLKEMPGEQKSDLNEPEQEIEEPEQEEGKLQELMPDLSLSEEELDSKYTIKELKKLIWVVAQERGYDKGETRNKTEEIAGTTLSQIDKSQWMKVYVSFLANQLDTDEEEPEEIPENDENQEQGDIFE